MLKTLCSFFTPVVPQGNLKVFFTPQGDTCCTQQPRSNTPLITMMMMFIGVLQTLVGLPGTPTLFMDLWLMGQHKLCSRVAPFTLTQGGYGRCVKNIRCQ